MNSELIVKDVEFHGDMLRAAQDPDGKVWVGVRWMCQGIGFGEDKIDNERKKIQKDVVISQGVKFHSLGSGNSNTKVLCLDLDYVPLWLAKIAITPTMQRENPVLVNKLIDYQLKARFGECIMISVLMNMIWMIWLYGNQEMMKIIEKIILM